MIQNNIDINVVLCVVCSVLSCYYVNDTLWTGIMLLFASCVFLVLYLSDKEKFDKQDGLY